MPKYEQSSETIMDFFGCIGRGFYIPNYQRPFSWDEENAHQLISDLIDGMARVDSQPKNEIFLGTIILHDQRAQDGVHVDVRNLLTRVSNVVDGQQRISSISILAAILHAKIRQFSQEYKDEIYSVDGGEEIFEQLVDTLEALNQIYAFKSNKSTAEPRYKPIVIRALGGSPAHVDQWTANGDKSDFYQSPVANFLAHCIAGCDLDEIETDQSVQVIVDVFQQEINQLADKAELQMAKLLSNSCGDPTSTLVNCFNRQFSDEELDALSPSAEKAIFGSLALLALAHFLQRGCSFVVIDCTDESLALDMFQSLNATGMPLTSFEVFKPRLVVKWGTDYDRELQEKVRKIEEVLDNPRGEKEKVTSDVVAASGLIYDGTSVSKRFSAERKWLIDSSPNKPDTTLVDTILGYAEYYQECVKPKKPRLGTEGKLAQHLVTLGLSNPNANLAAFCIYYLRDAKNALAHPVLAIFYSKLLDARRLGNASVIAETGKDFLGVSKATAAFFTLYRASGNGTPEEAYRSLFSSDTENISGLHGVDNRNLDFVKSRYRKLLGDLNKPICYDEQNTSTAKTNWVNSAAGLAWYPMKAVCRFALFVSCHDAVPSSSTLGFYENGQPGAGPMLLPEKWFGEEYEVIEHVATRQEPTQKEYLSHFDEHFYPGNKSVVDQLGNLTLWSRSQNSSTYSEWPPKVFYYWSLTEPAQTVHGPSGDELMQKLGLSQLPPSLSDLQAASSYLHHLAPLAVKGIAGENWTASFVRDRSKHLCERVFDVLESWLR